MLLVWQCRFKWGLATMPRFCSFCMTLNSGLVIFTRNSLGFPRWHSGKEYTCQCRIHKKHRLDPWVRKTWNRQWLPDLIFLLAKFHGQRILAGNSQWGRKESDMTEHNNRNNNKTSLRPTECLRALIEAQPEVASGAGQGLRIKGLSFLQRIPL